MADVYKKTYTTRKPDGTKIDTTVSIPARTVDKGFKLTPHTHATHALKLDERMRLMYGIDTQPGLWEEGDE